MSNTRRQMLALASLPLLAHAQAPWPNKPLKLVVAYPPGGVSDDISRAIAERLSPRLGVPVLVENRAGAGGGAAMEMLARAAPDGQTLVFSAISPLALLPLLGKLNYDPQKDIAPVIAVMATPVLVLGTPTLQAGNFAEMIAAARARPGTLRWATSGNATTGQLVLEQVRLASGADIVHIPYKGGGQQLNDALGGQFELLSSNVGATQLQYIRSGRLKALAVGAPARVAALPEVPTLAELGHAQANLMSLFGVFAPGATPPTLLERLNTEIDAVLAQPAMRQRLLAVDNLPVGGSAAEFQRLIARDTEANRRLVERGLLR